MNSKRILHVIGAGAVLVGLAGAQAAHAQGDAGFVRWTEPKEKAFTLSVPRGWTVSGGLFRAGATDVRQAVSVEAPGRVAQISFGDPGLPTFATVGTMEQQVGIREGTANNVLGNFVEVYLHYMPALEFSRWYMQNRLSTVVDDLQIKEEKDLSSLAQKMQANANRQMAGKANVRVSYAMTEFTGTSKATGKPVNGAIFMMTQLLGSTHAGWSSTWHASPIVVGVVDDENKDAHQKMIFAAFARMQQSWKPNPTWQRKENQRVAQVTKVALQRSQAAARRAPAGGGSGGSGGGGGGGGAVANRDIMGDYWRRNAARSAQQHQFINYLRDEHDVVTSGGQVVTVPD